MNTVEERLRAAAQAAASTVAPGSAPPLRLQSAGQPSWHPPAVTPTSTRSARRCSVSSGSCQRGSAQSSSCASRDAEIAELLGCAPGTVRGYASRALAALRIELSPEPPRGPAYLKEER